jgi:hypothetical protein
MDMDRNALRCPSKSSKPDTQSSLRCFADHISRIICHPAHLSVIAMAGDAASNRVFVVESAMNSTHLSYADMPALPLSMMLANLDTANSLAMCECVCRSWRAAAATSGVWEAQCRRDWQHWGPLPSGQRTVDWRLAYQQRLKACQISPIFCLSPFVGRYVILHQIALPWGHQITQHVD